MDTLPIRDQKKSIMMTSRQKAEARNKWYNTIQTSEKKKNCQNIILFLVKIHWSNDDISRVCKSYVYVM